MTVSSASLIEAKESIEGENGTEEQPPTTQQPNQQQTTEQQNDVDASMADGEKNAAAPEVGSSSSWTKKISAWFSGVRI